MLLLIFVKSIYFKKLKKGLDKSEKRIMLKLNAKKKSFTWYTFTSFLLTGTTHMLYRSGKNMPSSHEGHRNIES